MKHTHFRKSVLLCLAWLLCALCFVSCGSGGSADKNYSAEGSLADKAPADFTDGAMGGAAIDQSKTEGNDKDPAEGEDAPQNDLAKRKIIKNASLRGETLSFSEFMKGLDTSVASYGAYVESSRIGTYKAGTKGSDLCNATVVVRVPADRYDAFMKNIGTLCNILDSEETVDDVTLEYVDVESRIKAYRAEEASLLAMLEKAKTVSELITVEERLSQVRYEIESCQSRLNALSDMIAYSTVTLNIYEVENETVTEYPSVFGEIKTKFSKNLSDVMRGLRNFFVFVVSGIPYFLPFLVVLCIVVAILVLVNRREKKKKKKASSVTGNFPHIPPQGGAQS